MASLTARDQEGQLERLLLVQSRVAERFVASPKILILKPFAATRTLCDRVSRQLQVHATQEGAHSPMYREGGRQLAIDASKRARLDACCRRSGVPWTVSRAFLLAFERLTHALDHTATRPCARSARLP